jgi:hypothetical protein
MTTSANIKKLALLKAVSIDRPLLAESSRSPLSKMLTFSLILKTPRPNNPQPIAPMMLIIPVILSFIMTQ